MKQWGFYFNQSRCLGCKACVLACKNWNELRRGDANSNKLNIDNYTTDESKIEDGSTYVDPQTGSTNYAEYRKYYMKESWRRIETYENGAVVKNTDGSFSSTFDRRYMSLSCNHCDDPACLKACPMGTIYKDAETGVVLNNNASCISCGRCKSACPWDAPQFYDDNFANYSMSDPARPKMTKCTLCLDRTNEGLKPACVAACWNRALDADTMDNLEERYQQATETLTEFTDLSTRPNILFKTK